MKNLMWEKKSEKMVDPWVRLAPSPLVIVLKGEATQETISLVYINITPSC